MRWKIAVIIDTAEYHRLTEPRRDVTEGFGQRVLAIDLPVVQRWAAQSVTQPLPVSDALIAATAAAHGLTLVTRNAKDFERAGVQIVNPFHVP